MASQKMNEYFIKKVLFFKIVKWKSQKVKIFYKFAPGRQRPHLRWHRVCQGRTHSSSRPNTIILVLYIHLSKLLMESFDAFWYILILMICIIIRNYLSCRPHPACYQPEAGLAVPPTEAIHLKNLCLKMETHTFNCNGTSTN